MGFARACSVALVGVDGVVVEVQADLEPGVAAFTLVGLPDKTLVESRDRVRAAVVNSGAAWPQKKLTVGLSPASVPKGGAGFDLAVAAAVLGAAEVVDPGAIADLVLIGELGLDGRVRPVRGILPAVLAAAEAGYRQVVVPQQCAAEAALVPDVSVLGVRSLRQLIAVLADGVVPEEEPPDPPGRPDPMLAGLFVPGAGLGTGLARGAGSGGEAPDHPDLSDVAGQHAARRALGGGRRRGTPPLPQRATGRGQDDAGRTAPVDPAAAHPAGLAGGHRRPLGRGHPPARRTAGHQAPVLRPAPLGDHAVAGRGAEPGSPGPGRSPWPIAASSSWTRPPSSAPRPWTRCASPSESGHVVIARAAGVVRLPARFLMLLAANPCPCGRHNLQGAGCECPASVVRRYQARLSGPLLDRVDLRVEVEPVTRSDLLGRGGRGEDTATVADRVREARARAAARLADTPWRLNSEVPGHELRTRWPAAPGALAQAERDLERGLLTARGLDRVLRVAWTVADLRGRDRPDALDVAVALELRTGVARGATLPSGGGS
ncbi:YifB family Mg chelatase-like AAA ATPase [Streptomyces goshikiensis]